MTSLSGVAPPSTPPLAHIHALSKSDTAVLSACTEFPTFSDALAKVVQFALPVLEMEVVLLLLSDVPPDDSAGGRCPSHASPVLPLCALPFHRGKVDGVDVAVSLPAFAWDAERRASLPVVHDNSEESWRRRVVRVKGKAEQRRGEDRKIDGEDKAANACASSPLLLSALHLFRRLASICADVSVAMWLTVPSASRGMDHQKESSFTTYRCLEARWHRGHEVTAAATGGHPTFTRRQRRANAYSLPSPSAPDNGGKAFLTTRCCVRGLFDNLPLRQSAFRYASVSVPWKRSPSPFPSSPPAPSLAPTWATMSASAQRTRREEQTHLLTVLFQTALCSVLAPLYLGGLGSSARSRDQEGVGPSFMFSARLFAENVRCIASDSDSSVGADTQHGSAMLPLSKLYSADTEDDIVAGSHRRGAVEGLACDRYGLRSGRLVVHTVAAERMQCPAEKHSSDIVQSLPLRPVREFRKETQGEATARALCDAFGVTFQPLHTGRKRRSSHREAFPAYGDAFAVNDSGTRQGGSSFSEIVVAPGEFAIVFHTPPASPWSRSSTAMRSVRCSSSAACRSPYFRFPLHERHSCSPYLIVVGRRGASQVNAALPPLANPRPLYEILDPSHWAYDVVDAQPPCCQGRPVPVFIFVDTRYVPRHHYESRSRTTHERPETSKSPALFTQLYGQAVKLLAAAHVSTAAHRGAEAQVAHPVSPPEHMTNMPARNADPGAVQPALPLSALSPDYTRTASKDNSDNFGAAATRNLNAAQEGNGGEVELRMNFVLQCVREAAAAPGTQSLLSSGALGTASKNTQGERTTTQAPPHRVRLTADVLWRNAMGRGGDGVAPLSGLAGRPRRTPISLHPKLSEVIREEEEESAMQANWAAAVSSTGTLSAEGMTRMRHLLDTGRGSVLRQLPRACNPPQSWTPGIKHVSGEAISDRPHPTSAPPIEVQQLASAAVLPWARKFFMLAHSAPTSAATASFNVLVEEKKPTPATSLLPWKGLGSMSSTLPLPMTSHPHQLQWWVVDQHAVHERARLEFFLCFADTYVLHPELHTSSAAVGQRCGAAASLSSEAQQALKRRERHARLLQRLEVCGQDDGGGCGSAGTSATVDAALPSFPVLIPAEWRLRVGMVEVHLRQWGWRFLRERRGSTSEVASSISPPPPTAVVSWPRLAVEGVEHSFTSQRALMDTVEELEALGGASAPPSPLFVIPAVFLRFFISRSCRGAIMFGDAMTAAAARQVVAALESVEQYYVCSHGRPSFASLVPFTAEAPIVSSWGVGSVTDSGCATQL